MVRTETVFTKEELFDEPERSADYYDHIKRAFERIDYYSRINDINEKSFTKYSINDREIRDIIKNHAYHAAVEIWESLDNDEILSEVQEYLKAPTDAGKAPTEKETAMAKDIDKIIGDLTDMESTLETQMYDAVIPLLRMIADFNKEYR